MGKHTHRRAAPISGAARGVSRMAIDATTGLADLVQALHRHIARAPTRLGGPTVGAAVGGLTDLVYDSVRGITRAVGFGLDALLAQLGPLLETSSDDAATSAETAPSARTRELLLAALNGVLGDYLADTKNPLAIPMALRREGVPLLLTREGLQAAFDSPRRKLMVLVHGLCMNDLMWARSGTAGQMHDHGAALARDLGFTQIYLHYNSGQHISSNGHAFAAQLEALVAAWPVPVEELVLIGHSMGGLVARSAVHYGTAARQAWPRQLRAMMFLGTPHHGAPLERGGHWIDVLLQATPYTAPFARLGRVRSAGITDLRHGGVRDEDWLGRDRFAHGHDTRTPLPLPTGVICCAVAGTTAVDTVKSIDSAQASEPAALPGDGLVPVVSALGLHPDPRFVLGFAPAQQWIAWNTGHLDLLSSVAVCEHLKAWLAQ